MFCDHVQVALGARHGEKVADLSHRTFGVTHKVGVVDRDDVQVGLFDHAQHAPHLHKVGSDLFFKHLKISVLVSLVRGLFHMFVVEQHCSNIVVGISHNMYGVNWNCSS